MRRKSRIHDEEAQGLIEFALIAVVLLYFFLGTIDFGRVLYYDSAIHSAAETGALVASNHCAYAAYACGTTDSGAAVSDNFVVWSTYCEASPAVNLNLGQYPPGQQTVNPSSTSAYAANGSIDPCTPNDTSATWVPTCANGATCTPPCGGDICVAPANRMKGTTVSVTVGYDFQPITPLMATFFHPVQCWQTTDSPAPAQSDPPSNNHTLCATAVGQVY